MTYTRLVKTGIFHLLICSATIFLNAIPSEGKNMLATVSERQKADLAAIEKLHQTDMAAAKIHDIKTLITLWTNDGILFLPDQEPIRGKTAIWKYMQEQLPESQKYEISEYLQQFEEVQILGDWAYEWATFTGTYHLKNGGPDLHERARLFRVLRRQPDGSWLCHRAFAQDLPDDRPSPSVATG